ncbi:MAG: VWA domain-containing protein [Planctomycetes bacterium]|nr:VWA domain-containing protein [Planctomycetota bacterium]
MEILFGRPEFLYGLWGLLPLALLLLDARRRRARAARRLLDAAMRARLLPPEGGARAYLPLALLLIAFACWLFAAARPRFGAYYEQVTERGADLVVILDVSRSMLSEDVRPNRLERSKLYVRDLLAQVKGDRVGLVVFAGKALPACPLTSDHAFFESILAEVGPDSAPRGGTVIGDAIREAVAALDQAADRDRAFVLITDGEDHDSFPLEAAAAAASAGVRIFTVGIGDAGAGARIPVQGGGGDLAYMKHEGQEVWSKMDEELLKGIALNTGGAYVPAGTGTYDLGQVYSDHLAGLRAGALDQERRRRYREQYQLFAGLGLLFFLVSLVAGRSRRPRAAAAAALSLVLPLLAPAADAGERVAGAEKHNAALERLRSGEVDQALSLFAEAEELSPAEPRIALGRGAALQQKGELDGAREQYQRASAGGDAQATALAHYNLGTLAAARAREILGAAPEDARGEERTRAVAEIEEAIERFRAALRLAADNEDARYNVELLRLWLKHVQDAWQKKDEEQQAREQDLAALAEEYLRRQHDLMRRRAAEEPLPASPRRDEELTALGEEQRALAEDCPNLKPKIDELLERAAAQQPGAGGAAPPAAEQIEQARAELHGLADAAQAAMQRAAEPLLCARVEGAPAAQREAYDLLDALWRQAAPFDRVLRRMIGLEDDLVEATTPLAAAGAAPPARPQAEGLVFDQRRVGELAPLLGEHAERGLEELEQAAGTEPDPAAQADEEQRAALEQARQQKEKLKAALWKARENVPAIEERAGAAAGSLEQARFAEALPAEEEVRRLLREIADLMPRDESQQGDSAQEEQKPEQQEQNEEPRQEQQPRQEEGDQQEPRQAEQERVEELLRKAAQREKEYKEKQKELQRLLAVPVPVEKDW